MFSRSLLAEFTGTAFLIIGVIGSGIMATNLTDDVGLQLLQNAIATGAVLITVILVFGPVSGGHFNPVVTIADIILQGRSAGDLVPYVLAQVSGGITGAIVSNLMFDLEAVTWSTKERSSSGQFIGEVVATVGLLLVIFSLVRSAREVQVPYAVAAYITGAYYFTSSTSFANPAVTVARMFSDTFAGIKPASAPLFIVMQCIGLLLALGLILALYPRARPVASD